MSRVCTGYLICDNRKFNSIEDAKRELERLRAFCVRMKKKQEEMITFMLGVSITNSSFIGRMGYDKPKNKGGKKQFICMDRVRKIDNKTGEIIKVIPCVSVSPHIHIFINGYGANSCANKIVNNLKKRDRVGKYGKMHLKTAERLTQVADYIKNQSTILRQV